jgi:molybdopterin-biosynthesis enzyme MoeA-like protein
MVGEQTLKSIGIYIIGDEILSGKREDKHLTQAIAMLKARGLQLGWAEYLGDDPARMVASFKRSFAADDVVFSFGGIGATPDDYTRQAVADALSVPIVRHVGAVAEIVAQFGEDGAYPKRVMMADFPQGALLIPNPVNRVAGFSVKSHYFVPGFPAMAWPMMEWILDTHYSHLFHQTEYLEQSIIVIGGIESKLIDLMNAVIAEFDVKVFSLPKLKPNPHVEIGAKGKPDKVLLAMIALKSGVADLGFAWRELEKNN